MLAISHPGRCLLLPFVTALLFGCGTLPKVTHESPESSERMKDFLVIAHRGASGYLPEHTLEGAAMAHAMGADYIEQDVVLTRDDRLIVLHDLYLDAVTDVAERFPGRHRADGRHYAIDFTLEEIRTLRVHDRVKADGSPAFPGRFPEDSRIFGIPTHEEEIELIQGLNRSTGRAAGLYIEPKSPAWHAGEGKDLMAAVLGLLARFGLAEAQDRVLLQSFDSDALRYARKDLHCRLRMVQLIGENSWDESPTDFDLLRSAKGLAEVAEYAQGIGPWLPQVVDINHIDTFDMSDLVSQAHQLGLFVHAYTLRADQLPPGVGSMANAVRILVDQAGLDGVFTDHPDQVIAQLPARELP
jgi:glycerophosphoryl diester phosphodiesterase